MCICATLTRGRLVGSFKAGIVLGIGIVFSIHMFFWKYRLNVKVLW